MTRSGTDTPSSGKTFTLRLTDGKKTVDLKGAGNEMDVLDMLTKARGVAA